MVKLINRNFKDGGLYEKGLGYRHITISSIKTNANTV